MARSTQSIPGNRERIAFTQVVRRILKLAERQWGVAAHWQLKERGLSTSAITRWTASGRLHRIYPGVYAVGHKALSTEGRLLAVILYAGPGAALSHASAAHRWELISYLPLARVRKAVAEADFQRRIDLEAIDAITGVGRPGSAKLQRALSLHRPEYARTLSPREDLFLDLCRHHGLPFPELNVPIGPDKVYALWREAGVIVEVDGGDGHGTIAQMRRDRERDLRLRDAGFVVLRYSGLQVTSSRPAVAADIRRALQSRAYA